MHIRSYVWFYTSRALDPIWCTEEDNETKHLPCHKKLSEQCIIWQIKLLCFSCRGLWYQHVCNFSILYSAVHSQLFGTTVAYITTQHFINASQQCLPLNWLSWHWTHSSCIFFKCHHWRKNKLCFHNLISKWLSSIKLLFVQQMPRLTDQQDKVPGFKIRFKAKTPSWVFINHSNQHPLSHH